MTRRTKWIRWILLAIGALLLVALVAQIGPSEIARALGNVRAGALWLVVPYLFGTALTALPWALLLPKRARPSALGVVSSRFAASGGNALLFGLGGEPCRLLWLPRATRGVGLAGIVLDRLLFNASTALFLACGVFGLARMTAVPRVYVALAAVTAIGIAALSAAAAWAFFAAEVGRRVHGFVLRLGRTITPASHFGREVDASFRELVKLPPRRLAAATTIHFAGRLVLAVEVYVALRVLGADVGLPEGFVLASTQVALSAIASWIPSQVGVHEGGQALVCAALGIDPALGVAAVLLQRVRQLLFVAVTPALIASAAPGTRERTRSAAAPATMEPPEA